MSIKTLTEALVSMHDSDYHHLKMDQSFGTSHNKLIMSLDALC